MRVPSLLLVLALVAPVPALAGPLSKLTACDYKRLEVYYALPRAQVKRELRAGLHKASMIDTPRGPMLDSVYWQVTGAHKVPAKCAFSETSYTAADAEALAAVWGTDSAGARAFVEQKIAEGWEDDVLWALDEARNGVEPKLVSPEGAALDAFWASEQYSYCDARLVAAAWETDPFAAKIGIGTKLMNHDGAALRALEQTLVWARTRAISRGEGCAFWETDYTATDAQKLAVAWGTSVDSAKVRIADMVLRGQNQAVLDLLRRAP